MTRLERRYRRLIALYPADYRAEYEEEMVGVLLASSTPERRVPDLREALDLVWSAMWVRVRPGRGSSGDGLWTRALAVLGLVGSLLLLGRSLRPAADALGWYLRIGMPVEARLSTVASTRAAVWAVIAVVVLFRWRLAAATLAWGAVLAEVALLRWPPPRWFPPNLDEPLGRVWPIALALLVASALTLGVRAPAGAATLGWRRTLLVGAAALAAAAAAAVPPLLAVWLSVQLPTDVQATYLAIPNATVSWAAVGTGAVMAVLLAVAVVTLDRPLRRRVLGLAASALTLVVAVNLSLAYAFAGAIYALPAVVPAPLRWPLVIFAPILVLLVSVLLIRRRERRQPDLAPER
jgi:hypothetical protein